MPAGLRPLPRAVAPLLGLHMEPRLLFCRLSDVGNSVQKSKVEAMNGEL